MLPQTIGIYNDLENKTKSKSIYIIKRLNNQLIL